MVWVFSIPPPALEHSPFSEGIIRPPSTPSWLSSAYPCVWVISVLAPLSLCDGNTMWVSFQMLAELCTSPHGSIAALIYWGFNSVPNTWPLPAHLMNTVLSFTSFYIWGTKDLDRSCGLLRVTQKQAGLEFEFRTDSEFIAQMLSRDMILLPYPKQLFKTSFLKFLTYKWGTLYTLSHVILQQSNEVGIVNIRYFIDEKTEAQRI